MIRRFDDSCRAPLWARGGHAQTLLGFLLSSPGERLDESVTGVERVELSRSGGDTIVTFDAEPQPMIRPRARGSTSGSTVDTTSGTPLAGTVVHLFHGLTGSSESNYMCLAASVLRAAGARVVLFNHRGQGAGAGLARDIYHSGSDADLFASVERAREAYPDLLQVGVGFSLSANTLLLGAARAAETRGMPDAVLAVNPPVDLRASVIRIESGVNRLYDRNFVRGMRVAVAERQALGFMDPALTIPKGASVRGADEAITAPLAGYPSGDAYYADCSSGPRLAGIEIPTVILSSRDDPFISPEDVEGCTLGPLTHLHLEHVGGHLGYLSSKGPRRWLAGALLHYVKELTQVALSVSRR